MTKKQIIETIQNLESELYVNLMSYDYAYAPREGNVDSDIEWDSTDPKHRYHLHAWAVVYDILEEIGADYTRNENHKLAFDLSSALWNERQEARKQAETA